MGGRVRGHVRQVLGALREELERDHQYQQEHPKAYVFIDQMHRKFVKGRGRVEDQQVLDFVTAMCATGEAGRYGGRPHDMVAEMFAKDVATQARERFEKGRELLHRVKDRLRNFSAEVLNDQLNATLGEGFVRGGECKVRGSVPVDGELRRT